MKEKDVPRGKKSLVGKKLQSMLGTMPAAEEKTRKFKVTIALDLNDDVSGETPESGELEITDDSVTRIAVNGVEVSEDVFEEQVKGKSRKQHEKGVARMKRLNIQRGSCGVLQIAKCELQIDLGPRGFLFPDS